MDFARGAVFRYLGISTRVVHQLVFHARAVARLQPPQNPSDHDCSLPSSPLRKTTLDDCSTWNHVEAVTEIAIAEFPFVKELPKREKGKLQTLWENYGEIKKLTEEHGMLIPVTYAAELAGVSKQRIQQLINDGRLHTVQIRKARFVTESTFIEWVRTEHKNGRPFKAPSLKECATMAKRLVKQPSE